MLCGALSVLALLVLPPGGRAARGSARATGTTDARPGEFPAVALVALTGGGMFRRCGGLLLAPEWVATVAHCVIKQNTLQPISYYSYWVYAGLTVLERDSEALPPGAQKRRPVQAVRHEQYRAAAGRYLFDLALVRVEEPFAQGPYVDFARTVSAVSWPEWRDEACVFAGWGVSRRESSISVALRTVAIRARSISQCVVGDPPDEIAASRLCSRVESGDRGALCSGDAGGVLLCGKEAAATGLAVGSMVLRGTLDTQKDNCNLSPKNLSESQFVFEFLGFHRPLLEQHVSGLLPALDPGSFRSAAAAARARPFL